MTKPFPISQSFSGWHLVCLNEHFFYLLSRLVTPWIHERSCAQGLGLGRRGTTSGTCSRAKYGGTFLCLVIELDYVGFTHVSTCFRNFAAVQRVFLAATCGMSDGLLIYVSLKMLGTKAQENMAGVEKETSGNMEVFCGPWSWIWGQAETRYQHFTQFQRICQCSDALPGDLNPKTVGMESNRLPWNHPWKWSLILKVLQVQQYQTWREKNVLVYWFNTQSTVRNLRTRWEVMSLVSPVTRCRRCHFVWAADLAQC